MSAMQLAKQAYSVLNREKPHSSITDWVEILTSPNYADEAYDGIPELVDAINIQATGPAEASRAIRKKLKHGNAHQQYRALVILKALVENGGHDFQTSFADSHLTDAMRMLATESTTDAKVKKKLTFVLTSWHVQYKDDPTMSFVANLYKTCGVGGPQRTSGNYQRRSLGHDGSAHDSGHEAEERRKREEKERERLQKEAERKRKEEDKIKAKEEKERRKRDEEARRRGATRAGKTRGQPFDFEKEKPQILTAIASASQASINLVNAITLVNTEHDSVQTNERVQECLEKAKAARKQIVRYVQLVENEDMIGTLLEANDRIIAAMETYDTLSRPTVTEQDVQNVQDGLAAVKIQGTDLERLHEKQRAAVQRSIDRSDTSTQSRIQHDDDEQTHSYVHPDLQELSFGSLGSDQRNLPPPMRPSSASRPSSPDRYDQYDRGSLSEFSDYGSSDGETHNRASTSTYGRAYVKTSENEDDVRHDPKGLLSEEEDPFADPFMD
ncbi:hypothetical protein WOLCODRAFT_135449 [Wolfiporia cocos MD-104 SS10]|uniref:VHS domain-containing protein n=1 Tax=Wolfiporia cocos (strain MD-104) TaxID=742152 RepID=A0A2H3IX50_WOLCO|nr:hypothetical protein WOLCODRAFT_135449 [Wolfiporia cocos MD-104 SS10]